MTKKLRSNSERFLLYIDILGFTEMIRCDPRKVERIFAIINSLNVHSHHAFKTIVFSDTVLVYNPEFAVTEEQKDYFVQYLIEFIEDLHHRLTGQDVFFRAIITKGKFSHYSLENVECFFGEALVKAYLCEKNIPSIGLFIDKKCNPHNLYFSVESFDNNFFFVYLNRGLESLNEYSQGIFPVVDPVIFSMIGPYIPWQVQYLKDVHQHMRTHPDPKVRTKFLTAWDFYKRQCNEMLVALEQGNFQLASLARAIWGPEEKALKRDIRYFKRIK